jgi:hypothetical protein
VPQSYIHCSFGKKVMSRNETTPTLGRLET